MKKTIYVLNAHYSEQLFRTIAAFENKDAAAMAKDNLEQISNDYDCYFIQEVVLQERLMIVHGKKMDQ